MVKIKFIQHIKIMKVYSFDFGLRSNHSKQNVQYGNRQPKVSTQGCLQQNKDIFNLIDVYLIGNLNISAKVFQINLLTSQYKNKYINLLLISEYQIKLAYKQQRMSLNTKVKDKSYNKLIELDDKYQLQDVQIQKITSMLQEDQVSYLLDKKQKEKQKKRRIKQLQQQFQRKRKVKIDELQIKNLQSQKTRQRVNKQKLQKNKKNLQHVQFVHKKANQQHSSSVQKGLQRRKQFYSAQLSRFRTSSNKTQTNQNYKNPKRGKSNNDQTLNHSKTTHYIQESKVKIGEQMKKIEERLTKAKNNQLVHHREMFDRIHEKERHNLQIHQKIKSHSMIQQQKSFRQNYGKNEQILQAGKKVKNLTQRHLSNKRRNFQDKLRKLHQNIKYIQSQKAQKYNQLQNKFTRICENNWLNRTNISNSCSHRQRVAMNNLRLEQQKNQKADYILKKHAQITAKNKIYKKKKDQILQAIKKVSPQVDL